MDKQNSFIKTAGWVTIISVPFAIANFVLTSIAGGSDAQNISECSLCIL